MRFTITFIILLAIFICSCKPFPGPRKIDEKKEWAKSQTKLKALAEDILLHGSQKYKVGINDFPGDFDYPFDDGFGINRNYDSAGVEFIDTKNITITFYTDRGLLDHYSAIIYTNDSTSIEGFERNVLHGANDFKIESNWYIIND